MEFQASDSPAGGTPAVVVTVVFAADAVVEAVETVEEVVLPVVDPGPGIKEWLLVNFFKLFPQISYCESHKLVIILPFITSTFTCSRVAKIMLLSPILQV